MVFPQCKYKTDHISITLDYTVPRAHDMLLNKTKGGPRQYIEFIFAGEAYIFPNFLYQGDISVVYIKYKINKIHAFRYPLLKKLAISNTSI